MRRVRLIGLVMAALAVGVMVVPASAAGRFFAPARGSCSAYGCGSYSYPSYSYPSYQTYAAPVYETPYVPTVVEKIIQEVPVPAFVFQVISAYQQPVQAPAAPANGIYPPGQSAYGYGQAYAQAGAVSAQQAVVQQPQQPPPVQEVRLNADSLKELAQLVTLNLTGADRVPLIQDDQTPPPAAPRPQTPQVGDARQQGDLAAVRYFGTSCVECHNPANARGRVVLFDGNGQFRPHRTDGGQVSLADVYESVRSGRMPKGGPPVPPQIVAGISHWQPGAVALR